MMTFEDLEYLARKVDAKVFGDIRPEDLFVYLNEEVEELKEATLKVNKSKDGDFIQDLDARLNQIEEFGDVIFCMIAFARQNHIDIRQALSLTIIKLQDRAKQKAKNG